MKNSLILLAGGKGSRMNQDIPKQFLNLAGKPVIMHSLEKIEKLDSIDDVIIVCLSEYKDYILDYINKYNLKKDYIIVDGGSTRQESVYNGLKEVKNKSVILHEAARPFVSTDGFEELINSSESNITYATKIPYTVLGMKNNKIAYSLNRDELVNVQLPQKFNTKTLIALHENARKEELNFTDDSSLVYYYGLDVYTMPGDSFNIKITDSKDLIIGEEIYKEIMGE